MNTLYSIWFLILGLSILLVLARFIMGPKIQDRVISLDMFTTITSGGLVLLSALMRSSLLLDISLVYAILSFVSVLLIARFLEERREK